MQATKNNHLKSQATIQYILLLLALVFIVIILFYAYSSIIKKSTAKPSQLLMQYNLGNIYGGNFSFTAITNINLSQGKYYYVETRILFPNKTTTDTNVSYAIVKKENVINGKYYYIFNTTKFPVLTKNITSANAEILFIKAVSNYTEPLSNTSEQITMYNMDYYNKLPYYLVSFNTQPAKAGTIIPNASGYYKEGTKISVIAENTTSYGFLKWYGLGTGSYIGTTQTATIVVGSNITEYAYFEPKIPINIESNYKTEFSIGTNKFETNTTDNLLLDSQNEIAFPTSFYNKSAGGFFKFNNMTFCGTTLLTNTYFFTVLENYKNCTITANYTKYYLLTLTAKNGSILTNTSCSSTCYLPAGEQIKITEEPNANYGFSSFTGVGTNSYTGNSPTANIIMTNPITETAFFVPVENIYIVSNKTISFYFNGNNYQTNTIIQVQQNQDFSLYSQSYKTAIPGYYYVNSLKRYPLTINSTASTCLLSGTTFTATNETSNSKNTCTITLVEQNKPQYALIFNETLNSGSQTSTLSYGNIYFSNGTQAQHINWINNNSYVSFYATNNQPGYGFSSFTDEAGSNIDGYTLIGYSGTDGVATTPYPALANQYEPIIDIPGYGCGDIVLTSEIAPTVTSPAEITITNPSIEIANYNTNSNTTTGQLNITIHYIYYNFTFTTSGCDPMTSSLSSIKTVSSGTLVYKTTAPSAYTNYTVGIGEYTMYNMTSESLQVQSSGSASWAYSSNIRYLKNNNYLSNQFTSIYNNVNNYINSIYPYSMYINDSGTNGLAKETIVSYWYNLSGTTIYSNYISGTPNSQYTGNGNSGYYAVNSENLGISDTP